jgi:ketosteroid isomerase-like protein
MSGSSAHSHAAFGAASAGRTAVLFLLAAATLVSAGCGLTGSSTERPPANFGPPRAVDALPAPNPADRNAIRAVLRRQERAWNQGDLDAFMAGYARTDTLRFASGGNVRTGWQETLESYREGYPDRATMGTLSFSDLDIDLLSGRHALVFGRWRLAREGAQGPAGGLFTLLFEKVPTEEGRAWRVVYDHTSSG